MLNINKLCAIAVCAGGALSLSTQVLSEELSETGEFLDGVVAIVNEGVVLRSQLRAETEMIIKQFEPQGIPLPPPAELQEQILERLILEEIQLQRAARIGLQISDAVLNDAIQRIAVQNGVAFEELPALLAKDGLDYQDFRRSLRDDIAFDQLRRIDVGQRINVTPRELVLCLEDLQDNMAVNSEYNLSHILVPLPDGATAAQIAEVQERVDLVYGRLLDGADFRQLAVRYSDGQTALEGGGLGWIKGQELPTMFTDVVAKLEEGETSEPFRTQASFHIVKLNELRNADQKSEVDQVKVRHILIMPNEIIDDATAKQQLDDAIERIQNGEQFGEVAKLMSDDPGSAALGGDLGWAGPGTYVPEFEEVIATLELGVMSEPFRSPFGWHVLEVLDRRVYDNSDDIKEQNCDVRIRNSKMEEETQLWLRRIRDEAFVETRI